MSAPTFTVECPHCGQTFETTKGHSTRDVVLAHLAANGASSPKEISTATGIGLGNVAYHVRVLRKSNAIKLVRSRQRRGATEHYYKAV